MVYIFAFYTIGICLMVFSNDIWILRKNYIYIKAASSLGFLLAALYSVLQSGNTNYFFILFPGLLLCFLGDVFLGIRYSRLHKQLFTAGLLSFLMAHLAFIYTLGGVKDIRWYQYLFPLLMVVQGYKITKIKGMKMQGAEAAVLIYDFFVSLLLSRSVFVTLINGVTMRNSLFMGGVFLFWISDLILLFVIFYEKKYPILKILNTLTYYYGMFLIAVSVLYK